MTKYVWIKTQDGSPTLWNNEIGEPFRSVKGAFQESLMVFVKPAIDFALKLKEEKKEIIVCEFGLGTGSNWIFFQLAARALNIPFRYFAIERDSSSFLMALEKWEEEKELIEAHLKKFMQIDAKLDLKKYSRPLIFPSIQDAHRGFDALNLDADIWFHDPFGSNVNPEGYSDETLQECAALWADNFIGLSYACNGAFQKSLQNLGVNAEPIDLNSPPLKRQSLIFSRDV